MARKSDALRALRHVARETSDFLNGIADTSENLSSRSSEALIGTIGGVTGASGGYALAVGLILPLPFIPIALGAAGGIVSALLIWRGPQRLFHERRRKWQEMEFSGRIAFRSSQRKALGKDAPPELLEALDEYAMTGILPGTELSRIKVKSRSAVQIEHLPPLIEDNE